jgi:hypothetical protein
MYKKLIFLFLLLFSLLSFSQDFKTLRGIILDSENNSPIESVNISIINSSIGSITNSDGNFIIRIPNNLINSSLSISHIGYQNEKIEIKLIKDDNIISLTPYSTQLDDVVLFSQKTNLSANQIIKNAFDNYSKNFPNTPYISKGFLRHTERNKKEYKWLIEAGITMYDNTKFGEDTKIELNIDQKRKSFDNRKIDTMYLYLSYLIDVKKKSYNVFKKKKRNRIRDTISVSEMMKSIKYNDQETSGLSKLFNGHKNIIKNKSNFVNGNQNIIRAYNSKGAIFDKNIFKKHQFSIDTILLEGNRQVFKIKITPKQNMVNLNKVLKKDYIPIGWFYIYKDNFAIKELDYSLVAGSKNSKLRNSMIYGTPIHFKINLKYIEYNNRMYLNYYSCSVPKSLNMGISGGVAGNSNENFYYTKQELLFTEIIIKNADSIASSINWNNDLFLPIKYDEEYWNNNTILLESKEQKKLILDLEKKVSLENQFKQN